MNAPDFSKYSIGELDEALKGIDGEKYPERLELLKNEMAKRKAMGEVLIEKSGSHLWKENVPLSTAINVWWFYTWRGMLVIMILSILDKRMLEALSLSGTSAAIISQY